MNLILTYMGSPERLVGSNVRASLAEALEAVVPDLKDDGTFEVSKRYSNIVARISALNAVRFPWISWVTHGTGRHMSKEFKFQIFCNSTNYEIHNVYVF